MIIQFEVTYWVTGTGQRMTKAWNCELPNHAILDRYTIYNIHGVPVIVQSFDPPIVDDNPERVLP